MAENKDNKGPQYNQNMTEGYNFTADTIKRILERIQKQSDPVIRYSLLLDKFNLTLELAISALTNFNSKDVPPETMHKAKTVFEQLQKELDDFSEYIRTPHLSPDHPVGNQILKNGNKAFSKNVVIEEEFKNGKTGGISAHEQN